MADVWVKRQTRLNTTREYENALIRADSISFLSANNRAVVASQLDTEDSHGRTRPWHSLGRPIRQPEDHLVITY